MGRRCGLPARRLARRRRRGGLITRYAAGTTVSVEKSKAEIEQILRRYGSTGFLSGWDEERAFLAFAMQGRQIKFFMKMPSPGEKRFTHTQARGTRRPIDDAHREWEGACRQSWRALALVIKAKLEAVSAGITVFEDEFLAHIVMPDGKTIAEHVKPQIAIAYERGEMPKLLPYYAS